MHTNVHMKILSGQQPIQTSEEVMGRPLDINT